MWFVPPSKSSSARHLTGLFQVAAAKGLVVGSFAVTRKDKSVVDYSMEPDVGDHSHQDVSYDLRTIGLVGSKQQGH
jgi:hypothetical protein